MTTWDEAKRRRNIAKHGVDLALAECFEFESAIIREDRRERYSEQREVATGPIADTLYVYVYTLRGDEDHAISLRRASPRERRQYAKEIIAPLR
jgi:uncharacterized DUF497 family protein